MYVCVCVTGAVGELEAGMAVSCQNRFKAPAAKLVYKLMH